MSDGLSRPAIASPQDGEHGPMQDYANRTAVSGQEPWAIVSLVLGMASVTFGCCTWLIGFPIAIGAIITGVIGLKSSQRGMAIAGIVLGAVGVAAAVFGMIWGGLALIGSLL